ncbi:MAG: (2Fe-2S)-binding protein [Pseudomonadota bacterium]
MIICSCTQISSTDIARAVEWMRAADPHVVITAGKVYRALGKRPVCGGCAQLFVAAAHESAETGLPMELRNLRAATQGQKANVEERREGII